MRTIAGLILLSCLMGCEAPLPEDTDITTLQILGIRSTPVQMQWDASMTLEAMWTAPSGQGEAISAAWFYCNGYVSTLLSDELSHCPLIQAPEARPVQGSVVTDVLPIPELVEAGVPGGAPYGFTVFLLLCSGTIGGLPAAGGTVDLNTLHNFCDGDLHPVARKWIDPEDPGAPPVRNPRFTAVTVEGESLPVAQETETTLFLETADTKGELTLTVTLDPESYAGGGDAAEPLTVRWYTTAGVLKPVQSESLGPEPLTAFLSFDGAGRYEVSVVVRGPEDGLSFVRIATTLAPK